MQCTACNSPTRPTIARPFNSPRGRASTPQFRLQILRPCRPKLMCLAHFWRLLSSMPRAQEVQVLSTVSAYLHDDIGCRPVIAVNGIATGNIRAVMTGMRRLAPSVLPKRGPVLQLHLRAVKACLDQPRGVRLMVIAVARLPARAACCAGRMLGGMHCARSKIRTAAASRSRWPEMQEGLCWAQLRPSS